jgi:hypothetical protein
VLVWLTAALTRSKRLPDFARFVSEPAAPKRQQAWQEMKAALMVITGHA